MKSKFFRKPSASEVIAGIVAFSLFAVPLALHLFVAAALPETMVGEAGLRQTRAYLLRFVGVEILRIGITLAVVIVYLRSLHWQYKEKQVREKPAVIVISLIFILGMSLIWTPKSSRVDVQGERFSRLPTIHAVRLLAAVSQDLHTDPEEVYAETDLSSTSRKYLISSGGRHTRASYATEYVLNTAGGTDICQLSRSDVQALKPYIKSDSVHQVMCYPHSGMLYALDSGTLTPQKALPAEEYYASYYQLTYDEDGYLRWTPVGNNTNLVLTILCDGERHLGWNAKGKSEYKPCFTPGHEYTVYLESGIPQLKGYTRVSNIVTVTEPYIEETTEFMPDWETVEP